VSKPVTEECWLYPTFKIVRRTDGKYYFVDLEGNEESEAKQPGFAFFCDMYMLWWLGDLSLGKPYIDSQKRYHSFRRQ
jgi:hypothetical protein